MVRRIELQGHRGARGLFPENTLEGFRAAAPLCDSFELDIAITADGVPVICHDPALNPAIARGPDGAWIGAPGPLVRDLTRDQLATYDVGRLRPDTDYAARYPDQRPIDGARVPSLAEVLALDPPVSLNIELKTLADRPEATVSAVDMAEAVMAVVQTAGAMERVMIESFDWRGPRHVRRHYPAMRVAWLTEPKTVADARLWWDGPAPADFGGSIPRAIAAEGGGTWAPEWQSLTGDQLAEARELGLQVLPWTVNEAEAMERLIAWGVDGLITDRPDIARKVLGRG